MSKDLPLSAPGTDDTLKDDPQVDDFLNNADTNDKESDTDPDSISSETPKAAGESSIPSDPDTNSGIGEQSTFAALLQFGKTSGTYVTATGIDQTTGEHITVTVATEKASGESET